MESNQFLLQHELIKTTKLYPKKVALIINGLNITYEKFYRDVVSFSLYFKKNFLIRGDRIIIFSGNSYLSIVSFFSALFCDAVPCVVDENYSQEVMASLLESLMPKFIIVKNKDKFKNNIYFEIHALVLDKIYSLNDSIDAECFKNTEQDLAMIVHTSGSTGMPKGVMLSHRNVLAALYAIKQYLCLNHTDIILSVLPLHFDYGLYQLFLSISLGATLVLEENALFINRVSKRITENKVTIVPCVPYLVQLLHLYAKNNPVNFCSVRLITNTGENLTKTHIDKIKKLFQNAEVFSMYGLTECKRCSYVPPTMLDKKVDSIGIPMPNLEMWIQDDDGNIASPYSEGDLVVSGPSVMIGYWQNQCETNLKIKFTSEGKKILITGDRALMDIEGYFYFKGRKDNIIKFKGAKFNFQNYIKKINELTYISRSYLFLDEEALIICIEIEKKYDDFFKLEILSLFPIFQKPSFIYYSSQFPALSNGKINVKSLELLAKEAFSEVILS